jgi:hypothetical protein
MVCVTLPKSRSVVSLSEVAEWRAKCGFQSRVQEQGPRDIKRMRQEENTTDAPCLIDQGLYLGSKDTEADKATLHALGVTHILQVGPGCFMATSGTSLTRCCAQVGEELRPANPGDFVYKSMNVYDLPQEDLIIEFPECFEFIEGAIKNGTQANPHARPRARPPPDPAVPLRRRWRAGALRRRRVQVCLRGDRVHDVQTGYDFSGGQGGGEGCPPRRQPQHGVHHAAAAL